MSNLNYFPTPVWRVLLLRAGSYAGDENLRSPDSADRIPFVSPYPREICYRSPTEV